MQRVDGATAVRRVPAWLLPVVAWLFVIAWHPAVLGFYHDDWATLMPMSATDSVKFMGEQVSRPVYGLLMSIARVALPAQPAWYQGLLALLIAASATALGFMGRRIAELAGARPAAASWAGAFSATTWIVIPWSMGVSAWPTTFPAQISVIAFCAITLSILSEAPLRRKAFAALPMFLLASLISEIFWLSFAPQLLILIATGRQWFDKEKIRQAVVLSLGFLVIQAFLGLQNRLWVWLGMGINRSFNANWPDTALLSLSLIPSEFAKVVVYPEAAAALLAVMVVIALAGGVFNGRIRFVLLTMVAIAAGMLISLMIFALAGYRIEGFGVFSRTTIVISAWLCFLPALVVAGVAQRPRLRGVGAVVVLSFIAILAASEVKNTRAWITSWRFEQALLASLPGERLTHVKPGSMLVIDARKPEGAAENLEAFWDTSGAISRWRPDLRAVFNPGPSRHFATMADTQNKLTTWDGKQLTQSWCRAPDTPLWSLPGSGDAYLWSYPSGTLVRLAPPARIGCAPTH